ncbi:class I SAM-dependent RNA methyltransferase [Nanchangia anserum]|uniref:Class I SAM-dependent RNA methyltransferase n=1 Tax=Nanchangia anserum TaxID=2692125 RepID=A0A8I0KVD6_9ACTO|nr:class I SAM-dependent RNA methyltransferase [Nanchangia anserum]MBD3688824.1 class I SAM-dependent RNA methyltransferase [Nanchangia anserum]QOX81100.1 class I SAM-dependent RNA methyltransferase [Nanchangia anserum]
MSEVLDNLRILKPVHGGYGLAFIDGATVFVAGAIAGERLSAQVIRRKGRVVWARACAIDEASPDRRDHVWPQAERSGVGGADLGHVSLAGGRRWKAAVIADALERLGSRELADEAGPVMVHAAPGDAERDGLGWRTRVEFTVDERGLAGMHVPGSQRVVALTDMPLASPDIAELGLLGGDSPWRSRWKPGQRIRAWGGYIRIDRTWHDAAGEVVADPILSVTAGEDTYEVRADDFWQAHREGAGVLHEAVARAVAGRGDASVAELYCGSGLFTRVLARESAAVFAVEGAGGACAQARANTADQGNVEVRQARVDRRFVEDEIIARRPGLVVMDPPRTGAGRETTRALARAGAERIVLIACDPAALARDAQVLLEAGYHITQLDGFDLFPYTHHVECVGVFDRARSGAV